MRTSPDQLTLRIAIPTWLRSRRRLSLIAGAIACSSVVAVGAAMWPYIPPSFTNGEMLSSSRMTSEFRQVGDNLNEVDTRIKALQAQLTALQAGNPDCLAGYTSNVANGVTTCTRGNDVMVKVGSGPGAFWIDKYEASVWSSADGTGTQYGITAPNGTGTDNYPSTFPDNGQRGPTFIALYAVSKAGVQPSASLTWFQAQEACMASGKRLPQRHEWLAAASGTNDPGVNAGAGGACVTQAAGPRATGGGITCVSAWGAEDQIGNLWEWTDEWYAAPGWLGGAGQQANGASTTWGRGDYNGDGLWNIASSASDDQWRAGHPAAALRGGYWAYGTQAGVFALFLNTAPSHWSWSEGFRCTTK